MQKVEELVRHGASLRAVAKAVVRCEHEAEDAAQESWLRFLNVSKSSQEQQANLGDPIAWMKGVVRNVARSRHRDQARERSLDSPSERPGQTLATDELAAQAEGALALAKAVQALPSSYREVIVRRYWNDQPPAEIAADLNVPSKLVRNRLHRALLKLRAELREESQSNPTSQQAWLGVLGLAGGKYPSSLAAAASTTTGVSVGSNTLVGLIMNLKTQLVLGLVLFGSTVTGAALLLQQESRTQPKLVAESMSQTQLAPTESDHLLAPVENSRSTPVFTPKSEPDQNSPSEALLVPLVESFALPPIPNPSADLASGSLQLDVVDNLSSEPLKRVTLNGVSGERIVRMRLDSPIDLKLSEGIYDLLLTRDRYDPLEIKGVEIQASQVQNLGAVPMDRGSGSLQAVIWAPRGVLATDRTVDKNAKSPASSEQLVVELHGSGRNPCDECNGPGQNDTFMLGPIRNKQGCEHCGYTPRYSRLEVQPGETFQFGSLAAGNYRAMIYSQNRNLLMTQVVDLEVGQSKWLEIEIEIIDLELKLVDAEGQPFTGRWFEEGLPYSAPIQFFLKEPGASPRISMWTPPRPNLPASIAGELELAQAKAEDNDGPDLDAPMPPPESDQPVDRVRWPHEQLWPSRPELSQISPHELKNTYLPPSVFRLQAVPTSCFSVLVACGPFFTEQTLDLENWDGQPIEILISGRCGFPSEQLLGNVSCNSCHTSLELHR